jgi:predicted nucleic acid-binding protein
VANFTLVDTDILIDAGRGAENAIAFLQAREQLSPLAVSVVTQMELIIGCQNKVEQRNLQQFLSRYRVVNIDEPISNQAVELLERYRLSHGLLIADAFIAATAITWNCALASKNQRDYRYISELNLLPYS